MKRHQEPTPPATDPQQFKAVVEGRRSVRKFTDEAVPDDILHECIDMAILAPNSSNLQPWEFVIVKSPEARKRLAAACMGQSAATTAPVMLVQIARTDTWRSNAQRVLDEWPMPEVPKLVRQYYTHLVRYHYAVGAFGSFGLVKRFANTALGLVRPAPRGPYTPTEMKLWASKTCALACENFMLAARAHGYDTCPMEGFDENRVKDIVPMADDAFVVMIISMGRRAKDGVFFPRQRFDRNRFVREI